MNVLKKMISHLFLYIFLAFSILSFILIDSIDNPPIKAAEYIREHHQPPEVKSLLDEITSKRDSIVYFNKNIKSNEITDVECLAFVIYGEARGEGMTGMTAVAYVVHNRLKNKRFWNQHTYCDVIKQKNQFQFRISFPHTYTAKNSWDRAVNLAYYLIIGNGFDNMKSPIGNAQYFNSLPSQESWLGKRTFVTQIGNHYFYK